MIVYRDKQLYEKLLQHPGLTLDENHPAVKLRRYVKDGNSVFKMDETTSIQLYRYYKDQWGVEILDEFGETVYDFKEVLGRSFCEANTTLTIKELFEAREVEKELLKEAVKEE